MRSLFVGDRLSLFFDAIKSHSSAIKRIGVNALTANYRKLSNNYSSTKRTDLTRYHRTRLLALLFRFFLFFFFSLFTCRACTFCHNQVGREGGKKERVKKKREIFCKVCTKSNIRANSRNQSFLPFRVCYGSSSRLLTRLCRNETISSGIT